jgi:hypothetical protein
MKHLRTLAAFAMIVTISLAAAAQSANPPKTRKSTPKRHTAKVAEKNDTAEQLRVLKEAIDRQQAAQQQLQQTQNELQQTRDELQQTQQTAQQAESKAAAVDSASQAEAQKVQSDLSDVHATLNTTVETAKQAESKATALEHPANIAYKGLRLSPGGFLELSQYYRSHATLNDLATVFQSTPLAAQGSSASGYNAHLSEYGISARSSRLSLRADADAGSTKLAGYFEIDFNGAAPTSNNNQSSSYTPRIRQAWARTTFADGWTITGGQPWSLITLNRKGTEADNANLWIPNTIDAQYSIGYNWGRFGELRVSKTLNSNVSLAAALDNPQSLPFGAGTQEGLATAGGGTYAGGATYSTNLAPDLIVKLAYDNPRLGHYEIKALGRAFRDRVAPTGAVKAYTNIGYGDGIGGGAVIPLLPKKVDFIAQGLYGKGISRYQDSGQYDFVVRSTDNKLQDIKAFSVLTGFETHPTHKAEFDLLFGDEYYYRSTYLASGVIAGYGAQTENNSSFYTEGSAVPAAAAAANNRNLLNGKALAYYDLYKGTFGTFRYGLEADYIERSTWSGLNGLAPKGNNKTGFATIRWILP